MKNIIILLTLAALCSCTKNYTIINNISKDTTVNRIDTSIFQTVIIDTSKPPTVETRHYKPEDTIYFTHNQNINYQVSESGDPDRVYLRMSTVNAVPGTTVNLFCYYRVGLKVWLLNYPNGLNFVKTKPLNPAAPTVYYHIVFMGVFAGDAIWVIDEYNL